MKHKTLTLSLALIAALTALCYIFLPVEWSGRVSFIALLLAVAISIPTITRK